MIDFSPCITCQSYNHAYIHHYILKTIKIILINILHTTITF